MDGWVADTATTQCIALSRCVRCRGVAIGLPVTPPEGWERCITHAHALCTLCRGRLATAAAAPATQIVTHLCYSDFEDILDAIDRMDGDHKPYTPTHYLTH
jgi:Cobalamin-independent synthase, Catalytic domain